MGSHCQVLPKGRLLDAEVVGFAEDKTYLYAGAKVEGLQPGLKVRPSGTAAAIPMGRSCLGRIINGIGQPIDGKGPLLADDQLSLHAAAINPLHREPISEPLDVGIRAINALLTVGRGQRIGLLPVPAWVKAC